MRVLAVFLIFCASTGCSLPRWPVEGPLTSPYGLRFLGLRPDIHRGVDISVPIGTPVLSMSGGKVEYAGEMRGYGKVVILRHSARLITVYGHLSSISVKTGDHVNGRQVLGLSGNTGNSTGPHLHFEVQRWGHEEDPVPLLGGQPDRRSSSRAIGQAGN